MEGTKVGSTASKATSTQRVRAYRDRQKPNSLKARSFAEKVYTFLKDHTEQGKSLQEALNQAVRRDKQMKADQKWKAEHPSGKVAEFNEDGEV